MDKTEIVEILELALEGANQKLKQGWVLLGKYVMRWPMNKERLEDGYTERMIYSVGRPKTV